MNSQLFIPKKCKVGFNLRQDTYTGKLGYVIAYDGKKWRKEASWEGWRQKVGQEINDGGQWIDGKWVKNPSKFYGEEVTPIEFDNVPTSGFVLNKKVGGYKSDWNMRQTYARVYDPRGFEFEINVVNLLYILEHSNCMKGKGLEGDFIYSWDGKDLVLLPSDSPEFQQAMNYTNLQSCKISVKDLVPGCSYKTKRQEDLVYVGRYMWYETDWYKKNGRKGEKKHIFYSDSKEYNWDKEPGYFIIKNDVNFLAVKNSNEPVSNFAEIIDKFNKNPKSSNIERCELVSNTFSDEIIIDKYNGPGLKKYIYFGKEEDNIIEFNIESQNKMEGNNNQYVSVSKGYMVKRLRALNEKTKEVRTFQDYYYASRINWYNYHSQNSQLYQLEDLKKFDFCDLYITLENGEKIKVETLRNI